MVQPIDPELALTKILPEATFRVLLNNEEVELGPVEELSGSLYRIPLLIPSTTLAQINIIPSQMAFTSNPPIAGTLTIYITNKIYQKIDQNYLPLTSRLGEAEDSMALNSLAKAQAHNSIAANASTAQGRFSFSVNSGIASGAQSFASGSQCEAKGLCSTAHGINTIASGENQIALGRNNIEDSTNKYALILGNGTDKNSARSNAHTIDWSGNAWYSGSVESTALILSSPDGTRYQITVDDNGQLITTLIN